MAEYSKNLYQLHSFEEAIGVLHGLADDGGILVAEIGDVHVALPWELEEVIRGSVGQRIGVLRTDLPGKAYLWRLIDNKLRTHGAYDGSNTAMAS